MAGRPINNNASGVLILIAPIALLMVLLFKIWPALLVLLLGGGAWNIWQRYEWLQWSQQLDPLFHQLIQENRGCLTTVDLAMKANISGSVAKRYLDKKAEEFGIRALEYDDKGTVYYFITGGAIAALLDDSDSLPETILPPSTDETPPPVEPQAPTPVSEPIVSEAVVTEESAPEAPAAEPELVCEPIVSETVVTEESAPEAPATEPELVCEPIVSEAVEVPEAIAPSQAPATEPVVTQTPEEQQPAEPSIEEEQEPITQEPAKKLMPFGSLIQIELADRLRVHSSTVYKRRSDSDFPQWSRSRDPQGIAWEYSEDTKEFYPVEPQPPKKSKKK